MKKNIILSILTFFSLVSLVQAKESNFKVKDLSGTWEIYSASVFTEAKKTDSYLIIDDHANFIIKDGVKHYVDLYIMKDSINVEYLNIRFRPEDGKEEFKEEIYEIINEDKLIHNYIPNYIEAFHIYKRK